MSATKYIRGACKCCGGCQVGAVIPRWQNITTVRDSNCATPPTITNVKPDTYLRYDPTYAVEHSESCACPQACGAWVVGGDLNGLSAQLVTDTVQDISVCATPDATHFTSDHNCYQAKPSVTAGSFSVGSTYQILTLGTMTAANWTTCGVAGTAAVGTVFTAIATGAGPNDGTAQLVTDMRAAKLFGWQGVLARKFWHGALPWTNQDSDPTKPASQTKYLTVSASVELASSDSQIYSSNEITGSFSGSVSVGSKTGILASSVWPTYNQIGYSFGSLAGSQSFAGGAGTDILSSGSYHNHYYNGGYATPMDGFIYTNLYGNAANHLQIPGGVLSGGSRTPAGWMTEWTYYPGATPFPAVTDPFNYPTTTRNWSGFGAQASMTIGWSTSADGTKFTFTFSYGYIFSDSPNIGTITTCSGTISLSDPYTASDCYEDAKTLLKAWDMSDMSLAKFRTDDALALVPLVTFDEIQSPVSPIVPAGLPAKMSDYGSLDTDVNNNAPGSTATSPGQHDINGFPPTDPHFNGSPVDYQKTWSQIPWQDPNDYIWIYGVPPAMSTNGQPTGWNGNSGSDVAQLVAPMRSRGTGNGLIISHNPAGSDRHWWPGAKVDTCASPREYELNGQFSDIRLPPVTLRWQALHEALGGMDTAQNFGNFPQSWYRQIAGELVVGKYVQSTQTWPAVNLGRPCGTDKYAVDQTTVYFTLGAAPNFSVVASDGVTYPFVAGDYILVENDGIYQVTAPVFSGTLTVGAKISDVPTGYNFTDPHQLGDGKTHLGKLRFPTCSAICGRQAATWSSGTLTFAGAQPNLQLTQLSAAPGLLETVYAWDSGMTTSAAITDLVRVSDTAFTSATFAPGFTVAWITHTSNPADYKKYSSASQKTGVLLSWNSYPRLAAAGTPPAGGWYAGVSGCAGGSATQFQYSSGACPAVVGVVPFYPPAPTGNQTPTGDSTPPASKPLENFPNQELFPMPDTVTFDDTYGVFFNSIVMLTMPDPFWQRPYWPYNPYHSLGFQMDEGNGQQQNLDGSIRYYAHYPVVEARLLAGSGLPVTGIFDSAIAPPFFLTGIQWSSSGYNCQPGITWGFADGAVMDWIFSLNVCAGGGAFTTEYSYVQC